MYRTFLWSNMDVEDDFQMIFFHSIFTLFSNFYCKNQRKLNIDNQTVFLSRVFNICEMLKSLHGPGGRGFKRLVQKKHYVVQVSYPEKSRIGSSNKTNFFQIFFWLDTGQQLP